MYLDHALFPSVFDYSLLINVCDLKPKGWGGGGGAAWASFTVKPPRYAEFTPPPGPRAAASL
jgi:hypothetical protein